MNKYSDCYYCGGVVKEQSSSREIRWKGKLYIFERVPLGVCTQCGEKVIKDKVLEGKSKPHKTIQVPVYEYVRAVA
ncbi:MAG: YgiT-type zinc finger protein [Deltaproteobacteria bacterium]|nr:YgiT-type zinc finger protein [Deltaproteobacteria bacterium]